MSERYCISVDWLQVFCLNRHWDMDYGCYGIGESILISDNSCCGNMYMERLDYSTNLWQEVYRVKCGSIEVATICRKPRSMVMEQAGLTIKMANRTLYSMEYVALLNDIISCTKSVYKGVTRLDICYDCNRLKNSINVQKFLYDYITAPPYQAGHIIRSGSSRVQIHGKRSSNGAMVINSMRWGSPASSIGAYCYNKTLELLEVKDKPWIRETWKKNGLISEVDDVSWNKYTEKQQRSKIEGGTSVEYVHTPVWRFEISIKTGGKDILDVSTGELFSVSLEYISIQSKVEELFYIYAGKVMDFRMSNGQKNIRYYDRLDLFEKPERADISKRPVRLSRFADTGRVEKMCYNKLAELQATYGDLSDTQRASIEAAKDLLLYLSGYKCAIIKMKREADYLMNLRSNKYIGSLSGAYIAAVEDLRLKRDSISSNLPYEYLQYVDDLVSNERVLNASTPLPPASPGVQ